MQLKKKNYLDDIVCGARHSALLSSDGDLWLCGNIKPEKKKVENKEEKKVLKEKDEDKSHKSKKKGKKDQIE